MASGIIATNNKQYIEVKTLKYGLEDGVIYNVFVRATDAAGHVSPIVRSNSVVDISFIIFIKTA